MKSINLTVGSRNNARREVKKIGAEFPDAEELRAREIEEMYNNYEVMNRRAENDEADRRRGELMKLEGEYKQIVKENPSLIINNLWGLGRCDRCKEYLQKDTACPLINNEDGLCGKSLLEIRRSEEDSDRYEIVQFGIK